MNSLGNIFKKARESKKMILRKVASEVDIDQSLISKFEKNERKPTKEQVIKLAEFYELSKEQTLINWYAEKIILDLKYTDSAKEILKVAEEKLSYLDKKINPAKKVIKVVELFAGVGGFRLGLEKDKRKYSIIWSNQWEPSTKMQHASMVYEAKFGKGNHSNKDITTVLTKDIPNHDLLVGGFPCQDYSVATTLNNSKGLKGKKGVLWWSIYRILEEKKKKPKYLFLENVDRLLKSPSKQRGRDFAVMLKSLNDLGYAIEWRVINAADYGMPQRRRRVFFLGYHKSSNIYKRITKSVKSDWILNEGTIAKAFPVINDELNFCNCFDLEGDLIKITNTFNKDAKLSPFMNAGLLVNGTIHTMKTVPLFNGDKTTLRDILIKENIPNEFYIDKDDLKRWNYLKGAKKEVRKTKEGFEYNYNEGKMIFPDSLDNASRTIITGEGGKSPSRFKHVVEYNNQLRRLTPVELERLNMFPDNHTLLEKITDAKRAFFMGNALVVGVVEKIGKELFNQIYKKT